MRSFFRLLLTAFCLLPTAFSQVITTVAGSDLLSPEGQRLIVFRGDGSLAKSVALGATGGVFVDPAGNLFAADHDHNLVVKILPSGALQVVGGNGLFGFSGDGGPATSAELALDIDFFYTSSHLAVDGAGNLYIADTLSNRIRRVSPDGVIRTVAGSGASGFSGDGGPATSAALRFPTGVAVDAAGNLYIADKNNHRVRKVNPSGTITTVAGDGFTQFGEGRFRGDGGPAIRASLNFPRAVAVDAAGNLYIADHYNHVIRKVDPGGAITSVAGVGDPEFTGFFGGGFSGDGGPATRALLSFPSGVAADAAGSLYIADADNHRVRKVGTDGIINTVAGDGFRDSSGFRPFRGDGGPATAATLSSPVSVAVDAAGNLYISDSDHGRLRKVTPDSIINTVAGNGNFGFSGDGGQSTSAALNFPQSVAVDAAGNLYVADSGNNRIRRVTRDGLIGTAAGNGERTFSGDDGPATSASLAFPSDVAVDAAGNLYIADNGNQRVRKVTSGGAISTAAGNGTQGFSGDGGPATGAALKSPRSVALDPNGNFYIADNGNQRVRKVTSGGTISTAAGNGTQGFSGDGGPATGAALRSPAGLAADTGGNLYIADNGNQRIRKVTSGGAISTAAGNGTQGFAGDGGAATGAALRSPTGVAVDAAGNLYIADTANNRIRKVTSGGTISTVAGRGTAGFSGDGGPATTASLNAPGGVALDGAGNLYIADTGNHRIRKVLASAPAFAVAPGSLSFSARAGAPVVAPQLVAVTSDVAGLGWSASASAPWLAVSPASGLTPGLISVSVNVAGLDPGTYRSTVTVQAPAAAPSAQTSSVELTVLPASAAQPTTDRSSVTFETSTAVGNPSPQALRISNAGSGSLSWTARAETLNGGNWLRLSSTSGSASAASPATIQVSANVGGLAAGVYSGLLTIESPTSTRPLNVPVDLLLSQVTQTISLSQTALQFTAVEGEAAARQSLGVVNTGQGIMIWTVQAETVNGGDWLAVSPASGQSDAVSILVPQVEVSMNPSGLRAGSYAGLLRVEAPGANNSPRLVTVTLTVLPKGSKTGTRLSPPGMIFSAQAGASSPSSQLGRLTTTNPKQVDTRGQVLTLTGGNWLQVLPTNLAVSAADPRTIVVQPTLGSLAPGEYRAALTYQFSDESPAQAVNVFFVVVGGASPSSVSEAAAACTPQKLVAVDRTLGPDFAARVGAGSPLEVQVVDDCGNAVADATVVATFSNGDAPVTLASLGKGIYTGVWRPATASDRVAVTLRVSQLPLPAVELLTQGRVDAANVPAVFAGGIVNAASYTGGTLAPGSIVSVFGRKLASTAGATSLPLPKTLGGATLQIGGTEAPLFYSSDGQINAQLPFELAPSTRPQAVVKGADFITVPETITIAPARPGIFTLSQDGKGQGAILDGRGRVVDANAPATPGDVVAVYCTGLGATQPAALTGQAGPSSPPATATIQVTATAGGVPAPVQFAGLAPGFVGLYQVNVQIPAGITAGTAVPLVLSQNGVPSNVVTLAVR